MENSIVINAENRATKGKGPAREMRRNEQIPAVIYGKGREPQSLSIIRGEFDKIVKTLHGEVKSTVFDLTVDGKATTALIREVQKHPTKLTPLHIDFYEIHAGVKIHLDVPLRLVGTPEGVKNGGGVLDQTVRELQVEVFPRHIPDHIEIDVTALDLNDSLHISDIVAENVEILNDPKATICSVIPPRVEEEEPVEGAEDAAAGAEPEIIGKPKDEEGDESGS
jgi:large subunit ribosomal protein L25